MDLQLSHQGELFFDPQGMNSPWAQDCVSKTKVVLPLWEVYTSLYRQGEDISDVFQLSSPVPLENRRRKL